MSKYGTSERDERQQSGVSSEQIVFYVKPSPILKFSSGPADTSLQREEDESPNSSDRSLKTTNDKNWTKPKVPMVNKYSKAEKLQDAAMLGARSVDMNSNSLPPGTGDKAAIARTDEHYKVHGASRLLKVSRLGRESPPFVHNISPPAEDFNSLAVPKLERRQSDPSVSRTNRQHVNRKTVKPASLMRRVSPMQLLSRVSTNSNAKAVGVAKRLYPAISKIYGQLSFRDRGGSDPAINMIHDRPKYECGPFERGYDLPSQIHYLAEDIERLNIHQYEGAQKIKPGVDVRATTPSDGDIRQMCFKDDDVKLQGFMEEVLRARLLALTDYKPANCDRTSRNICKLISNFLSAMQTSRTHTQIKFACLVYIGAVRDHGIHIASGALWNPDEDSFAAASFRNEFVYGLAVVIATPID